MDEEGRIYLHGVSIAKKERQFWFPVLRILQRIEDVVVHGIWRTGECAAAVGGVPSACSVLVVLRTVKIFNSRKDP